MGIYGMKRRMTDDELDTPHVFCKPQFGLRSQQGGQAVLCLQCKTALILFLLRYRAENFADWSDQ